MSSQLQAIRAFQVSCRTHLIDGVDYGVIPNTGGKPTLFKPGAEKMIQLAGDWPMSTR